MKNCYLFSRIYRILGLLLVGFGIYTTYTCYLCTLAIYTPHSSHLCSLNEYLWLWVPSYYNDDGNFPSKLSVQSRTFCLIIETNLSELIIIITSLKCFNILVKSEIGRLLLLYFYAYFTYLTVKRRNYYEISRNWMEFYNSSLSDEWLTDCSFARLLSIMLIDCNYYKLTI